MLHDPAHAVFIISKILQYQAYGHSEFFNASCISAEAHCTYISTEIHEDWVICHFICYMNSFIT